ncbi:ParA family protein, partial [Brevibacillus sp. MCWH]|nr:ParA family protein [Brevibacillus sp. MCWH]
MCEVWTVSTRKGGVLKTTLCVNIAGVLSKKGKVLIVDLDAQGNVALSFGINPDKVKLTIRDLLTRGVDAEKCIINVYENIDIIASNDDMNDFEFEVIPDRVKYPDPFILLKDKLENLKNMYDYIIIDTPPNFGLIQANALMFADKVLVPYQPEKYSMRALVKIVDTVRLFKRNYNPNLKLSGVVATMVDMRTSLHCEIMEATRKFSREKNIPL